MSTTEEEVIYEQALTLAIASTLKGLLYYLARGEGLVGRDGPEEGDQVHDFTVAGAEAAVDRAAQKRLEYEFYQLIERKI